MSEEIKQEEIKQEESLKKNVKKKLEQKDKEIEKLHSDIDHWKNEYYRAYADMQNLRKSLEKDHMNAMKYRAEGFIDGLLPVLDSFHMAVSNKPSNPELQNYVIGFEYIYKNLIAVLENEGVKELSPSIGDTYNVTTMDAVDTVEAEEANKITRVYANGYMIHDRLVRPARVQVSVLKKEEKESQE